VSLRVVTPRRSPGSGACARLGSRARAAIRQDARGTREFAELMHRRRAAAPSSWSTRSSGNSVKYSGLRPWRPGQSGNPNERPKGRSEVTRLALTNCPKAILKLVAIMEDPNVSAPEQIRAAEAILDRGLGKVVEFPDEDRQTFAFF